MDNNGKPSNLRLHNHTVHVNIYSQEQVCVTYLLHKTGEEWIEGDIVLMGSSGLVSHDQDSARGKLFLSHFLLNSAGWEAGKGTGGEGEGVVHGGGGGHDVKTCLLKLMLQSLGCYSLLV